MEEVPTNSMLNEQDNTVEICDQSSIGESSGNGDSNNQMNEGGWEDYTIQSDSSVKGIILKIINITLLIL